MCFIDFGQIKREVAACLGSEIHFYQTPLFHGLAVAEKRPNDIVVGQTAKVVSVQYLELSGGIS